MILIGLAGAAGSGKDTVADYLVRQYGFVKFSFSDELYREVSEAFNVPVEELQDRNNKEKLHPQLTANHCADAEFAHHMVCEAEDSTTFTRAQQSFSPRWVLQHWGTEYRRAQDPDYWVRKTALWIEAFMDIAAEDDDRPAGLVNTSVRFPNEQALIRELGGTVWHLRRFIDEINAAASGVASCLDHVAEQGLPVLPGDRELFNAGTVEQLHTAATLLLQAPFEENPELVIDPDFNPPNEAFADPVLVVCAKCSKLHLGIPRAQAEQEVAIFNEWLAEQSAETREVYGNSPASVSDYEGCVRCGAADFTEFKPVGDPQDVASAISVSPVIYEGAK
jgi:hypothetical protein